MTAGVQQIISHVNINPEDYVDGERAAELCRAGNAELEALVRAHVSFTPAGVGMVPMNNIPEAVRIVGEVAESEQLVGIQIFTRALGKSIAAPDFRPLFAECARLNVPLWLHPVFDDRKPDNGITFSWEYELTQAMLQLVQAGLFREFPNLKILVHHAGAMVPFFGERMRYTLPEQDFEDFHKFYVDTAILGNPKALELAMDFYGADHLLFGTDAPFGIPPLGATDAILSAIERMRISEEEKDAILRGNATRMLGVK